ncbi:hypothetical protein QBC44DRAFT_107225 [Cladorrhinum sp. PSN332]|nr:hypothetical protein QBC44DRAFT_107225 [Cladorrhinum sp. PSN332]
MIFAVVWVLIWTIFGGTFLGPVVIAEPKANHSYNLSSLRIVLQVFLMSNNRIDGLMKHPIALQYSMLLVLDMIISQDHKHGSGPSKLLELGIADAWPCQSHRHQKTTPMAVFKFQIWKHQMGNFPREWKSPDGRIQRLITEFTVPRDRSKTRFVIKRVITWHAARIVSTVKAREKLSWNICRAATPFPRRRNIHPVF